MKDELRDQLRTRLAALDAAVVRQHSAEVWERLAVLPEFSSAEWVLAYISTGWEIETHGLIRQLLALGRHVCVPAFDSATQSYRPAELQDYDNDLSAGKFGILEPKPGKVRCVPVETVSAWLVPGLAFARNGDRLGRGRGYFDSLLRQARGTKIGLAHDCQLLTEVPIEPHDVRMDFIITENQTVDCQKEP